MSDESVTSVDDEAAGAAFEEAEPAENVTWTDGQLMRLENEFRKAQRSFAYHPVIGIRPLRGDPPHEYQIDYRMRALATNEAGELEYVDEVSMHVWLPPGFPNQPPVVRPMAPVFHPNVAWEGVYLTRPWQPTDTLVTFAARIGELLAYRSYDPDSVVNAMAMEWLSQNGDSVPLDTRSDFSPFNGGEPLGRIQRLGPGTLEQIRRALDDMRFALVAEQGAPNADEVADFSRQTQSAVSMFLDDDVPDNLRQQASEFDGWCRELPKSVPMWEYLRRQRTRAAAAEAAAAGLRSVADAFGAALDELARLAPNAAATSRAMAIKVIPSMEKLAPLQLKLPPLARDFEKFSLESRKLIAAMKAPAPQVSIAPEGSLGRRIAAQAETVRAAVASATRSAESALADVDALYRRSRPEIQALEQVVGWREYMDMFAKAHELERQLGEWGSGGVQAFFLDNGSGSFGPFQFEEPLDLGSARIVVRSTQRGQLEVINAVGQEVLGRAASGRVVVNMKQDGDTAAYQATFILAERCDDLVVQIGFIQQQTVQALNRLQRPVPGATSWCGVISAFMAEPQQQQNLRDTHRKATHRWKGLIADLAALARFKERLATYHLVARMTGEVSRVQGLIDKTQARHEQSTAKISAIISKSGRDIETNQLIIPPKLIKSYTDELHARDQARHEVARLQAMLKQIARELAGRLSSSRLVGRPEVPALRAMPQVPDALHVAADAMGDEPMKKMIAALDERLGVKLPFNAPPPPPEKLPPRPAEPPPRELPRPEHVARPAAPPSSFAPEETTTADGFVPETRDIEWPPRGETTEAESPMEIVATDETSDDDDSEIE